MNEHLTHFGLIVKRCRQIAGLSQQRLADRSGVSQSVISRLERGKAPRFSLERLLSLQLAMGMAFPLGACPHDHNCPWKPIAGRNPSAYLTSTGSSGRALELRLEGQRIAAAFAAGANRRGNPDIDLPATAASTLPDQAPD